jgi:WD40 repeat protein
MEMVERDPGDLIREQGVIVRTFSRVLGRETHVLTQHSDLIWQQLYNRLQWEGEVVNQVLAPEQEKRCAQGARPWARTRTPYRESQLLIRTLIGHTDRVYGCAVSPDGHWIVSASADKTLKIWDPSNGKELRTLKGHTSDINACAISPDGTWIVSASLDKALKIRGINNASKMHTLYGRLVCKIKAGMAIHPSTNEDFWKGR